jgi:AmiR/NasT family two-component response regulator
VLDAVAIRHSAAPAGDAYSREAAIAEARALLTERPHLTAREAQTTLRTHRRW